MHAQKADQATLDFFQELRKVSLRPVEVEKSICCFVGTVL